MRRFRFWRRRGAEKPRHSTGNAEDRARPPPPEFLSRSQSQDRDEELQAAVLQLRRLFDQLAALNLERCRPSDTDEDTEAELESDESEDMRPGELMEETLKVAAAAPKAVVGVVGSEDVVTLTKMMKAYPPLLNVQISAVKLLITIDREVPRLRLNIVRHALVYALQAMRVHQSSGELQMKVLKLLVNVSVYEEASMALIVHKGVKAISSAVRMYPNSLYIAKKAILLMRSLSQSHQNHFEVLRQDGAQLIFRVLRLAARDSAEGPRLAELAMESLRELAEFASANEIYKSRDALGHLMERVAQFEGLSDSGSDGAEEDEVETDLQEGSTGFAIDYPDARSRQAAGGKPPLFHGPAASSQEPATKGVLSSFLRSVVSTTPDASQDKVRGIGLGRELGFETDASFDGLSEARAAVECFARVHNVLGVGKFSAVMLCSKFRQDKIDAVGALQKEEATEASGGKQQAEARGIDENQPLAIKVMFRRWSQMSDGQRSALTREAGLLLSLQQTSTCSQIVRLLDVAHVGSHCCLVFPHCGPDAHFLIVEGGPFSVPEARSLARQLLLALDHIAKCDVIHRDIKPENMLIQTIKGGGLHLVVADFGFARTLSHEDPLSLPLGTFGYIAPEVLFGDGYGTGADVWAAGISVLRMLLGYPTATKHTSGLSEEEGRLVESGSSDPWLDLWTRCQVLLHHRKKCLDGNGEAGGSMSELVGTKAVVGENADAPEKSQNGNGGQGELLRHASSSSVTARFVPVDSPGIAVEWDASLALGTGWSETVRRVEQARDGGAWDDRLPQAAGFVPKESVAAEQQDGPSDLDAQDPAPEPRLPAMPAELSRMLSADERGLFLRQDAPWQPLSELARLLIYARRKIRHQSTMQPPREKEAELSNRAFSFNPFTILSSATSEVETGPDESQEKHVVERGETTSNMEPPANDIVSQRRRELEEACAFLQSALELDKWRRQTAGELLQSCDWIAMGDTSGGADDAQMRH